MPTKVTKTIGRLLHADSLRRKCIQCHSSEVGIAWEYVHVLEFIKSHPGCIQSDISESLHITPAAVTQSTKKLESAGLMRKVTECGDLRSKKMYLTPEGERTHERGTEIFDMIDEMMFDGLSDEDISQLNMTLDRMNQNMAWYLESRSCKNRKE